MKTIKLLLATTLLAGLSTLAFAGPSPQFWTQQSKDQQERKAQNSAPVKAPKEANVCAGCSCCTALKK